MFEAGVALVARRCGVPIGLDRGRRRYEAARPPAPCGECRLSGQPVLPVGARPFPGHCLRLGLSAWGRVRSSCLRPSRRCTRQLTGPPRSTRRVAFRGRFGVLYSNEAGRRGRCETTRLLARLGSLRWDRSGHGRPGDKPRDSCGRLAAVCGSSARIAEGRSPLGPEGSSHTLAQAAFLLRAMRDCFFAVAA